MDPYPLAAGQKPSLGAGLEFPLGAGPWLILAVDAGGSSSRAAVARAEPDGRVYPLGFGAAGAGNPLSVGFDLAVSAIETAISEARRAAGGHQHRFDVALLAVAGAASGATNRRVADWGTQQGLAKRVEVAADWAPVIASAGAGPALAIISGTGSVAVARGDTGSACFAGGWGYLLGDDGSGFAIGREAVRLVLGEAESGIAPSPLARAVLEHFQAADPSLLAGVIHRSENPRTRLASLTSIVFGLADADPRCRLLIDEAAAALADTGARAARRAGSATGEFALALAGGALAHCPPLRAGVERGLRDRGVVLREVQLVRDATRGGLMMAAAVCHAGLDWRFATDLSR